MSDFRLKAFYSVAKNLSFTRAAKELFVSQPAITKHINELERQILRKTLRPHRRKDNAHRCRTPHA